VAELRSHVEAIARAFRGDGHLYWHHVYSLAFHTEGR
jgi:hypothetical protein